MTSLGIDTISVFGLPPMEFATLVSELGCQRMGVFINPMGDNNPHNYPAFNLIEDAALRRETKKVMDDLGVTIGGAEGFFVLPGMDIANMARELDIVAELEVGSLTTISLDQDRSRTLDQIAVLAEMTGKVGINLNVEFVPFLTSIDLPTALEALRHAGSLPHVKLMVDALHVVRSGLTPADIAAVDPALIGAFQFCDGPMVADIAAYSVEAGVDRMTPGQGEFPLRELVAALPPGVVYSLEIPQLGLANAGVGPFERLKPCVDASRAILADIGVTEMA